MAALLLKLTLAPALVAVASLVARRLGHRAGGLISGLPVVAAPVVLIFAVEQGDSFAREAAMSACLGIASSVAFCVAYALTAVRHGPASALLLALLAFVASTLILSQLDPPFLVNALAALVSIGAGSWTLRQQKLEASEARPGSDLLAWRLVLTAVLVLALSAAARGLSAHLAGLLVPLPIITGVMAGFTHARAGAFAVTKLLAGLVEALTSFLAFFVALTIALSSQGQVVAFATATVVALVCWAALLTGAPSATPAN